MFPLVVIALCESLVPTLTLASVSVSLRDNNDNIGIAFGLVELLDSVVSLIGNAAFGMLFNLTGGYRWGMTVLFVLSLVALVLLLLVYTVERKSVMCYQPENHNYQNANENADLSLSDDNTEDSLPVLEENGILYSLKSIKNKGKNNGSHHDSDSLIESTENGRSGNGSYGSIDNRGRTSDEMQHSRITNK